jgi:hypothetical protein
MMHLNQLFRLFKAAKKDNTLVDNHLQNDVLKDFIEHKKELEYLCLIVASNGTLKKEFTLDVAKVNYAVAFYSQINRG